MTIVPYVCAEFYDEAGNMLCSIPPSGIQIVQEVPDAIRHDPLFRMLVADGSLKAIEQKSELKALENDPGAGHDAAGKAVRPPEKEEEAARKTAKAVKAGKARAEADHAEPAEASSSPAN